MRPVVFASLLLVAAPAIAQTDPPAPPPGVTVPDWSLPGSSTHTQVAPPADFHRESVTVNKPIGVFENQTEVGAPIAPGDATYDKAANTYTITASGYNIWYTRDEFRYLWKKMSGDVSLAASFSWPDPAGYGDRKVALVIRQSLNDDAVEALVAQHGAGMVHLARREAPGVRVKDMEYRVGSRGGLPGGKTPDSLVTLHASRIGIEKKGDTFQLWISWEGEKMHPEGAPITLKIDGPFYVGVGLSSHLPATTTQVTVHDLVMENRAGKVR